MRKDASINEAEKNKALLEAEKNIDKFACEAELLALKAQRRSMLDLLAESYLERKRVTELKSEFLSVKAKVQQLESLVTEHQ